MGTAISTRSATRSRRLVAMLVALTLALGGLGGLGAGTAAAQDVPENDADQITQREFDRLTRAARKNEVVFGPEEGALELEEENVAFESADVEVENFLVRAEFTNPYDAADGQWDYGFQFRSQSRDAFLRLILISDGTWGVTEGLEGIVASDIVDTINDGAGDTNVIDLYVEDDIGHFGLNGDYVVTFELPVDGAGDITVGSGFLADSFQEGAETEYAEWLIWTLDEGNAGPDDETPTRDPDDLSDDDLTATAEAEDEELSDDDMTATAEADEETPAQDPDEDLSDDDLTATAEAEEDDLSDDDLTATAEAEDEERGNADDPTYTSPTFGYTLSYEEPWELADEVSDDDGDLLELRTSDSNLQIVGNETRDTPEECIDALVAGLEDTSDVVDAEIAQDERDRDLRDDSDELSWVVVFVTLEGEDNEEIEVTGYYECRVIEEGESLLTIIHLALSDDYNDEIENRTAVLDTIEIDDGGSAGPDDDLSDRDLTATAEAEDEETPTEEADDPTEEADDESTEEATAESDVPEGSVAIFLEAVGDDGVTGLGLIEPSGTDGARVTLVAFGASGFVTIHEGSCRNPDETPAFEVGQLDTSGSIEADVDAPVEELTNGDYVMIVSDDGTTDAVLACGALSALAE